MAFLLSPWSPAGMSPLISHPASAAKPVAFLPFVLVLNVFVWKQGSSRQNSPKTAPNSTICHVATPFSGSARYSSFFLTWITPLILWLMIEWPIVSASPDDPVSASFISCKKWATFCEGLHGEVERPAARTSVQAQCEVKRVTEQSWEHSPALLLLISKDNLSDGH